MVKEELLVKRGIVRHTFLCYHYHLAPFDPFNQKLSYALSGPI